MDKILHVASTFKSHENDDGSVMIRGMASTDHSDRAGDVIAAEARERLGFELIDNTQEIRVPANIAGSASNPDQGGRPAEEEEE